MRGPATTARTWSRSAISRSRACRKTPRRCARPAPASSRGTASFPGRTGATGGPRSSTTRSCRCSNEWARRAPHGEPRRALGRRERLRLCFGAGGAPWDEEKVLDRYELLYEAGLVEEARRDGREAALARGELPALGEPMRFDHRRILATAIARLRAKLKYRPVVFELMPAEFTLTELQRTVEAISGRHLHKQNFRRLVETAALVEPTGETSTATGGRPAALFRFRREVLPERPAPGLRLGGRGMLERRSLPSTTRSACIATKLRCAGRAVRPNFARARCGSARRRCCADGHHRIAAASWRSSRLIVLALPIVRDRGAGDAIDAATRARARTAPRRAGRRAAAAPQPTPRRPRPRPPPPEPRPQPRPRRRAGRTPPPAPAARRRRRTPPHPAAAAAARRRRAAAPRRAGDQLRGALRHAAGSCGSAALALALGGIFLVRYSIEQA